MVKLMGHIAMGLLWALPAWFLWDGRVSLAFIGFVLATVMLPDVDLVLQHVVPGITHHGVTHTLLFVAIVALLAGVLVAYRGRSLLERWWVAVEGRSITDAEVYLFVTGGLLLGGTSHIFADMLSAPDIAPPVEPLWPIVDAPISFDVVYYSSIWWNLGLLLLALALHLVLGYLDMFPLDDRRPAGGT